MASYDLREPNPFPEHITDAQWWFWEQLHALEPTTQLGGFYANKPGYHNKRKNLIAQGRDHGVNDPDTDYSIRREVDRRGPDNRAAACDWSFPEAWSGDYRRAAMYGARVRAAFNRRDSRLAGWREFLGQTDGDKSVAGEGLDFHTWTTRTPDSSHETHHHLSEDREQVGSFENKAKMLSILAGYDSLAAWLAAREGDDMDAAQFAKLLDDPAVAARLRRLPWQYQDAGQPSAHGIVFGEMRTNLAALRGADWVNEQQIIDGVLTGLGQQDLDVAATALRAAFGDRVGELAALLAAPESQARG